MEIKKKAPLSNEAALIKLKNYCAYQERAQQEVTQKLADLGVYGDRADAIIAELIQENFLNEERFAIAFAGGRYRIKEWGKIRIRIELQQRRVSDYSIRRALEFVDKEGNYKETLCNLLQRKSADYEGRTAQLADVALRRGWESELVWQTIKELGLLKNDE